VYDEYPQGLPDLDSLTGPQQAVLAQLQVAEADLDRLRRDARSAGASP